MLPQASSTGMASYTPTTGAQSSSPAVKMENHGSFTNVAVKAEPTVASPALHAIFPQNFAQPTPSAPQPSLPTDAAAPKGHACEVCHKVFADVSYLFFFCIRANFCMCLHSSCSFIVAESSFKAQNCSCRGKAYLQYMRQSFCTWRQASKAHSISSQHWKTFCLWCVLQGLCSQVS